MPAMATALEEFSDKENSRTYVVSGHTIAEPQLVIQKRKVPTGNQQVSEVSIDVVYGTSDANGDSLAQKYTFSVISRSPLAGTTTDRDAALVVFRDIVASDEFGTAVSGQNYLA